jgi:signal transduction histidine kinase
VTENRAVGIDALSALHEVTAKIVASLDLKEVLASIARAMCEILDADIGAIYLLDEAAGVLRLGAIHGQRSAFWDGHAMSLDRGMNATAIKTGMIQRIDDYMQFPTELRAQTPVVDDEPMRSVIAAPMIHRGRRLGSMGAVRREVRPFRDNELALLEMLADHATIAVANALAFEELEKVRARETTQLREHGERMASLEKAKSEFLQLASHELRSPISVLRGYLSMMLDGSLKSDDVPKLVPLLFAKTQQMNLLINEMLETARMEAGPVELQLRSVDLRQVVRQSVERMQPLMRSEAAIDVQVPDHEVTMEADPARIEMVLTNLLDNAIKYSLGDPQVSCRLSVNGHRAQIEIKDQGIGIDSADMSRLFQRFSRINSDVTYGIPGTGLGLYLAQELVRRHGGEITVSSKVGMGSIFCVSLPLAPISRD